jgi:hypothetical protein
MGLINKSLCKGAGPFFRLAIKEPALVRSDRKMSILNALRMRTRLGCADLINDEPLQKHSWE